MVRKVSERDLQDFIEGRLVKKDQSRVRAYLQTDPEIRMRVEKLRKQADMMRTLGKLMMSEPLPAHLTDFIRGNSRRRTGK